jgi:hypothetical protein
MSGCPGTATLLTRAAGADLLDVTMCAPLRGKSGSRRLLVTALSVALASVIVARPMPAVACKDRKYPETFPVEELQAYSTVAVVKVGKVDPPAGTAWQAPPFRASGTVVKPLKGKLRQGEAIEVITERDVEGHAVCPIRLDEGSTYLLFLRGERSPYVARRFGSLYLEERHERFKSYVEAIAKASSPKRSDSRAAPVPEWRGTGAGRAAGTRVLPDSVGVCG